MKRIALILLILSTQVYASHFGPCAPFEAARGKRTMCTLLDQTVCVGPKVYERKLAKGWTTGRCLSPQDCGDGNCNPDIGEDPVSCPSDCTHGTSCCFYGGHLSLTENSCEICDLTLDGQNLVECYVDSHTDTQLGCVPN